MNKYANDGFNEQLLNSSYLAEKSIRVLKHDETFGIFDRYGDIQQRPDGEQGLFHAGTRFLSRSELFINKKKPLLLSSYINEDNAALHVDFTNPEFPNIPSGALHMTRTIFLWNAVKNEAINLFNYLDCEVAVQIDLYCEADYCDIFEIRGHNRQRRGSLAEPDTTGGILTLRYLGLDDIARYTSIQITPGVCEIHYPLITKTIVIPAKGCAVMETHTSVALENGKLQAKPSACSSAYQKAKSEIERRREEDAIVTTDNEQFNEWIGRSLADIHLLNTDTKWGRYPYAGVPWFSAPFGRDGIITALEMLWINPNLARSVLHFLAETQGTEVDPENDCEPGKIIHETRQGEMANLREIAFGKYYGSVDSTPLFILLASAYYERTGDVTFAKSIWPNVKAAINWVNQYGDLDKDGFVEYHRHSKTGLIHQGWKDSNNSVFHENGDLADAPISLCEVQAYLYAGLTGAANLAKIFDELDFAEALGLQAELLRRNFQARFWLEDMGCFALALDRDKKPCRVRSSNAGQTLFGKIANKDQARQIADLMLSETMFSGWGVRTIGEGEALYNPMSYHNGTIWPHDNALIGAGLAKYGFKDHCVKILNGLFDASNRMDFYRLPELFCGFTRSPGRHPILYPMSCAPQAWAAGSIFMLLGACLGIEINATEDHVAFKHPKLPSFLNSVTIKNLKINEFASVDMEFINHGEDVGVNILKRRDPAHVIIVK
ncbi:MAG: glycogen debranching N-terminal domain-containing protein [Oligoflexales bacterium]